MLFTLLIGNIQVNHLCFFFRFKYAKFPIGQLTISAYRQKGIFARGHSKEEEDAGAISGRAVVDEKQTVASSVEKKSRSFRKTQVGDHGRC